MEYLNLGRSGLKVSRLCFGMMSYGDPHWRPWILDCDRARPIIRRAVELGINFFDTADMYSNGESEVLTGKLLLEMERRENLVIATKVFMPTGAGPNERGLSRVHIMAAVDASLKRLGTDYIDLYQIHRFDPATPMEETLDALNSVVKSGKARYLGASTMHAWQFSKLLFTADGHGWHRFISMQNYYNLIYREEEREMIPLCQAEGVGVVPYSPLARGFLAGNRSRDGEGITLRAKNDKRASEFYAGASDYRVYEVVAAIAKERDLSTAQVAMAWLFHRPGVVAPVIGSTNIQHLEEAVTSMDVQFSSVELQRLDEVYAPRAELAILRAGETAGGSVGNGSV